ncbi:unnamed protein product [Rotaria sp. Silwood1]|nr:unnamed protein product [Rotaria sp. Silwood1]CAF3751666.1 unnamed protein product [Rotaria sp. Silwood1]CAF3796143.1 unnamed protein product [Rotaria sp. Silwood1]CAF4705574.1 unnamed protein product [Rotaria sp. Silwood1]CAF4762241.1 unnamed protein product [Rotaria sp. Silwood1]
MAIARSVAIIGGGIGGLTVANTLMRVGMSVSLYERAPYFIPTVGAGFGLQPNGQAVLAHIGFKEKLEQITHPFLIWQFINGNGDMIRSSNRLASFGKRFGFFVGGTVRAELVDILKAPIEACGNLHYNHNVINITQDSDGVTIYFENEKQKNSIRVDMVVGADGIRSTVVKKIFPQTPPPIYTKENIFYGVIDNIDQQISVNSSIRAKNTLTQYFDRGEFAAYRIGQHGEIMWAATYPSDAPPSTSGDIEWTEINNKLELDNVLRRFPKKHPIHECAAATGQKRLLHFGLYYRQHRTDGWHRGRVCLLGDSCHATLPYVGQGANMAIEDAISLAICLEKNSFRIEPSFQDYYNQRFDRTKRIVNLARYLGLIVHSQNPILASIGRRFGPFMMKSERLMKMTEDEYYEKCPIPMKPL